ncbi:MAG: hypothetical protein KF819_02050 [Labilithrix sp.]|nr:hypothetical protein [Labilithrix sp.]
MLAGALLAAAAPNAARADVLPEDAKVVQYSYEVENLDAFADKVFVAWPRACGSDGEPLGKIDLGLNPQWASRMHDVDYEVLEAKKELRVLRYCAHTMRIYALPRAAFPPSSRPAPRDDWALDLKKDNPQAIVPALDAIDLQKRMPFFASDARVARSPFALDMIMLVRRSSSTLAKVHDVIGVDAVDAATLTVSSKRVTYTYEDGATETFAYRSLKRPSPSRPKALEPPPGGNARDDDPTPPAIDAGALAPDAPSQPPAAAPAPASKDLGTRWVYLAAIAGLLVGGIIAWAQKNKKSAG